MRKRVRRKVWPLVNPVEWAITGAALLTKQELDGLRIRELAAIEAFRNGTAGLQDWHDLAALLNLCETMAREGIGLEALPTCMEAQTTLIEAAKRFERTGRMGTTGAGLQALRDLFQYHDLQRQSVQRSDYERVIVKATRKVQAKGHGVVVLA
jgi:hypothetical protein